ncbi:nitroreductase family protein [Ruminococcaceae bacterium OttesenSCG-928-I18]|nr:nitroreductase family protein [Ruminococcaceae bacterium OttesenSCG-928-I18]
MSEFLEAVRKRQSIRVLGKPIAIDDRELVRLLGELIMNLPTANNMQSTRMVLLLGEEHNKLWDIVLETLKKQPGSNIGERTEKKLAGFKAGHGSILFFDDEAVTREYMQKYPLYTDQFPLWALQQNGMLQFAVWTALADKEIGASLQHYNPLINEAVKQAWNLPEPWELYSQMPFGQRAETPGEKKFEPLEKRLFLFGQ